MLAEERKRSKPPYLLGLLGFIPLVGAFVGIGLILYAVFKYKDRLLIFIGAGCVVFTVLVYSSLFYFMGHSKTIRKGYAKIAQTELNTLVNQIEFYKVKFDKYPDSLLQLTQSDPMIDITDPLQLVKMSRRVKADFQYQKIGNKYTVFSVGVDGVPNTADDIYPIVPDSTRYKYGFVKQ